MMIPDWETVRSSEPYIDITIYHALGANASIGVRAPYPPQSLTDLERIASDTRSICGLSQEVDDFVTLLSQDPDADELVKLMPWERDANGTWLHLVVPGPDTFTDEAWQNYEELKNEEE